MPAEQPESVGFTVDQLAQEIRRVDGNHDLGAGALAEALMPFLAAAPRQPQGAEVDWPEKWSGPCTVGNMIANLKTLPAEMPIYTAYHVPMDDEPSLLKVKRPTLSRERVEGTNIKTGDESVSYSAVIWSQPRCFDEACDATPQPVPVGREATWHKLDDQGLAEVRVNGKRIVSMPSYPGAEEVASRINAALSQPAPEAGEVEA